MWFRVLLFAATALAGGVATLGRSAVDNVIKDRVAQAIDIAKEAAIEDLRRETSDVVRRRVQTVAVSLLWKIATVSMLFALRDAGDLSVRGLQILVLILTAGFAIRDLAALAPHLWRGYVYVRGHNWRPATALKEFVARLVFDRAYDKALEATSEPGARHAIALSSYTKETVSEEIALAVSDVAKASSIQIIRVRVALGAAVIAVVSCAYSVFIYCALSQA